jgi:hypothetical protein
MNWYLITKYLHILAHNKKVEGHLQIALAEGQITPELIASLNDRKNTLAHYVEGVIVLLVAALMVLKPF